MDKICCFSGHREGAFDEACFQKALDDALKQAIDAGYTTFYGGVAIGFDIIAAEAVLRLKIKENLALKLVSVVPFRGQDANWSEPWKQRHDAILRASSKIILLNQHYVKGCYHERNRFMVDNASLLICYFSGKKGGTKHTVECAQKKNLKIVNLLGEFKDDKQIRLF